LAGLTLKEASELLRRKAASPVELTQACLKRIDTYNSVLNAFITVTSEQALEAARAMEAEQRRGKWRGPLHGIPITLKDNIDTAGIRTTAASELFKDRVPSEDAEVVRRLQNAGAILLGKTNRQEFAYGEPRRSVISVPCTIPGRWIGFRAARQAVPPLPLQPDSVLDRWERILQGPSESPRAIAGSWVSSLHMDG
jgi:Asp-tRNA(Asn)/Glu-tRNA(Gln) amidotransferase A subunit family amidase